MQGQPTVAIVSGAPGSGKTTLAAALVDRLHWPVVSHGPIKAGLLDAFGFDRAPQLGHPVALRAYEVLYEIARRYVEAGVSVVVENAFRADISGAELAAMAVGADVRIVHCRCPASVALSRFAERGVAQAQSRQRWTRDHNNLRMLKANDFDWQRYEPVDIGEPVLEVNTSDGYDPSLDVIEAFIRGAAEPA